MSPDKGVQQQDAPLKIVSVRPFDCKELLARLKQTPLRGHGGVRLYAGAELELEPSFDPSKLAPAQRYVLMGSVRKLLELRSVLLEWDVDLLALDGGAYVRTADSPDEDIPVTPPFVEESHERDGRRVLLINDGLHRVYAARLLGLPISVVIARGVPVEYPYYAYALPGGWSEVAELEELPDEFQKKEYRVPENYKALFREFNAVFPGVQQQRKRSNPAHLQA
ncbi:MAG TPA: hypothetical protein VHT29_01075 [Solirubrobacteraceae bacterium]|jgi:hypothetical protein|nr:hypothetical protein [Solirubrobacteraceae bacterium]